MAKRNLKRFATRISRRLRKRRKKTTSVKRTPYERIRRSGFIIKRPRISDARIERGLRVLNETGEISVAARAIRVLPEKFKRIAIRKGAIRKRRGRWKVVAALPRRVPIFTDGKQLAVTVTSKTASVIGGHNSAVGQFARTNKPEVLAEFRGRTVKDIYGKSYLLETDPSAIYHLLSAGGEPFSEIYRIVL